MPKPAKKKAAAKPGAKAASGGTTRTKRESQNPDFARGVEVRRAMWGFDGADGQIDKAGDFIWPLQEVVTKYCFGQTWTRPKLSRKIRSMITMAMLVAMARPHELKVHIQGAIANGVTKEEIQEILLHAMVYAGIPRGVEGFRAAEEKLKEMGLE
ncbi:MAG: carboxymuconolactone decarboxylase family protein [Pseudorhodoplanes sp.]